MKPVSAESESVSLFEGSDAIKSYVDLEESSESI